MDDDDKVRRNLVVASSVTVLLAWLEVPLVAVADRLFGTKADGYAPSGWRVWLGALAVLLYLGLRFRFSHEVEQGIKDLQEASQIRYRILYLRNLRDLEVQIKKGDLPPGPFRDEVEGQIQQGRRYPHMAKGHDDLRPRIKFDTLNSEDIGAAKVQIPVTLMWDIPGQFEPNVMHSTLEYEIPHGTSRRLRRRAFVYALIYSRGSMVLLWPIGLAGLAAGILMWKLWQEWQ